MNSLVNHLLQSLEKDSFASEAIGVEFSIETDDGHLTDVLSLSNLADKLSIRLKGRLLRDCDLVIVQGYDQLFDMKRRVAVSVSYTY
jgi:hypothetical protein